MSETMVAYFSTQEMAKEVRDLFDPLYEVSEPERVQPINGRPWAIEIFEPHPASTHVWTPEGRSQILDVVLAHGGQVHEPAPQN